MTKKSYLNWINESTETVWWCDSGTPSRLLSARNLGCRGVTTNPLFASLGIKHGDPSWDKTLADIVSNVENGHNKAEILTHLVVSTADKIMSRQKTEDPRTGLVCGQINPYFATNREKMTAAIKRYNTWMDNLSIKVPCTEAGLDVMEDAIANGIDVTSTISFAVPQIVAAAEMYKRGAKRAKANGIKPGKCFPVIIFGRINDYIAQIAQDSGSGLTPEELSWVGVAISKQAYKWLRESGSETTLLVGGFREVFHLTELVGADMIATINASSIDMILAANPVKKIGIDRPVNSKILDRLMSLEEFRKSYEPDGLKPADFIKFGPVQRTIADFSAKGWDNMMCFTV